MRIRSNCIRARPIGAFDRAGVTEVTDGPASRTRFVRVPRFRPGRRPARNATSRADSRRLVLDRIRRPGIYGGRCSIAISNKSTLPKENSHIDFGLGAVVARRAVVPGGRLSLSRRGGLSMTGRNERGGTPARRIAGAFAAAMLLVLGAQWAVGAPSDKAKKSEQRQNATQAAAPKPAEATKPKSTVPQGMVTRSIGGVTIAIDPATGKVLPPTAKEAKALAVSLQQMLSRETDDIVVMQRPDG